MKMDGATVSTERNTVMGTYPARNGRWSYLHCNFPNHRAAALSVLGVPEDREAVRKAVAGSTPSGPTCPTTSRPCLPSPTSPAGA
jgi:hypothetical protein